MNELLHNDDSTSQEPVSWNPVQEMIAVLTAYLDNPTIAIELAKDQKTPPEIIQKIALNKNNTKAQIIAISRIVNTKESIYWIDVFNQILVLCNIDDEKFWWLLPEICIIILQWKNTPIETLEYIFQALRNNRPTKLWLSKSDQVIKILNMILESWNQNMTSWFLLNLEREIAHVKSLSDQWNELKASKVERIYTSGGGWSNKDPVGWSNYTHGNSYGKGKW